jgi:hypothetical protein
MPHCDACKVTRKGALVTLTDPESGASSRVCAGCEKVAPARLKRAARAPVPRPIGPEDKTPAPPLAPPPAETPAPPAGPELELGPDDDEGEDDEDDEDDEDEEVSP